ncbi:uncharacterized protein DEA37_0005964 [Paragonimus westermani]|uniref:Uncharacterized protein n=1 Tax=Paragonimus westermani TaxID=34504 RepID=A0A5J4NP95_9TREM|nr:uncharacterized protein DEA37_0005964 [Paragonimus westermani]
MRSGANNKMTVTSIWSNRAIDRKDSITQDIPSPFHLGRRTKCSTGHTFHSVLRHLVPVLLALAAIASVILLLMGIFTDHRACLTGGCILGLVCFGVMLHGCLSHRSLPNSPTPLVLSAACMYPMGNIPLVAHADAATAAAMATATLLPESFKRPSSFIASSLEAAMISHFQREVSNPSVHRQGSFYSSMIDKPIEPVAYERHVSDSAAYNHRSHGEPTEITDRHIMNYARQFSCPARPIRAADMRVEHIYANQPYLDKNRVTGSTELTRQFSATEHRFGVPTVLQPDHLKKLGYHTQLPPNLSTSETPLIGTQALFQPPDFSHIPTSSLKDRTTMAELSSISPVKPIQSLSEKLSPTVLRGHEAPRVRVVSPTFFPQRTLLSVGTLPRRSSFRASVSQDLFSILSPCETGEHSRRLGRRYETDRDGIFGPRVWRGWRSWVDP